MAALRWVVAAAFLLGGCLGSPAANDSGGTLPTVWHLGVAQPLKLHGWAATEPTLAVKPGSHGESVVVVTREIFRSSDSLRGEWIEKVVHRTVDAGHSWQSSRLPRSVLSPFDTSGTMQTGGDPSLAYAPDGRLFLAGTAANYRDQRTPGTPIRLLFHEDNSVFVTISDDDGNTWQPATFWQKGALQAAVLPVPLPLRTGYIQDRPWIDVGPEGGVHLAWIRWGGPTNADGQLRYNELLYTSSTDRGMTWAKPAVVATGDLDFQLHDTNVVAAGDGQVYVSATRFSTSSFSGGDTQGGHHLVWRKSLGGGAFAGPFEVGPGSWLRWGSLAADPNRSSRLVFAGIDDQVEGTAYWTESVDGGDHWKTPSMLFKASGGPQWNPASWIDDQGRAVIAFYDTLASGAESLVLQVIDQGETVFAGVPQGEPGSPGGLRADYLGLEGDVEGSWVAWIGGNGAGSVEGTHAEVTRLSFPRAS